METALIKNGLGVIPYYIIQNKFLKKSFSLLQGYNFNETCNLNEKPLNGIKLPYLKTPYSKKVPLHSFDEGI